MYLYKFGEGDIINNVLTTYPSYNFYLYEQTSYVNGRPEITGAFVDNATMVPVSAISLYEMNVDRPAGQLIYPFVTKDGTQGAFRTISTTAFNQFSYGDEITGSYPLSSSISMDYYGENYSRNRIDALRNTLNYYQYLSPQYAYANTNLGWDKATQEISLLSIPSIFYGSAIKKGTVNLRFFVSGTLTAEIKDEGKNGELIQVGPSGSAGSGSVAGVALYNEGFFLLTGSWNLTDSHTENYIGGGNVAPRWAYFGTNISGAISTASSSWYASFEGTNRTPVLTMFADAPKNHLIHSNNPTYIAKRSNDTAVQTSSIGYYESRRTSIKNIASSSFKAYDESFEKMTYISKIVVYDDKKNVVGVAKLANPVRKTAGRQFTFKLKLDI